MNITDIGHLTSDADSGDDKMVKGLKREGLPLTLKGLSKLAQKYEQAFKDDLRSLNIEMPHHFPRATEYLQDEIALIEELEKKGFAYKIGDGVYFDTEKLGERYGRLGGLTPIDESRERVGASEKKSPRDFVLWKLSQDSHLGFSSPWGSGFPGWHIECSAMSRKILGQPFDIHTGGIDHIPVHHNNEIAQSEAAYDAPLANFWLHGAFLTIDEDKMSKSLGNFTTLEALRDKKISPLVYRYLVLGAHYRSPLNFTLEGLEAAGNGLAKLVSHYFSWGDADGSVNPEYKEKFTECVQNDLNIPQALALAWELVKETELSPADKKITLKDFDRVFGLGIAELAAGLKKQMDSIPDEVKKLVLEREKAREAKNFSRSDELRVQIEERGFLVKDTPQGPALMPK
jgi:cysteinyl-tRNA synthetase